MFRKLFPFLLAVLALPVAGQQTHLPTTPLTIGQHEVVAELAQTPEQRALGLMHRFPLPPGRGMLFVFPAPEIQSFWMKNTPAPLSIAYIDADGVILNTADMMPFDERTQHPSRGPALYALEVRQGWFREVGIRAGDVVKGLPPPSKQ